MLEKILQHNKLGNQFQILYILKLLSKGAFSIDDLNKSCISAEYSFSSSFKGIICLLKWLDIIKINGLVQLNSDIQDGNFVERFCTLLFLRMASENELHNFINNSNLTFNSVDEPILVNNSLIKFKFSSIRNLLINLELFKEDDSIYNRFVIPKDFSQWFVNTIIPFIEESRIKNRTLEDFKKSQTAKNKLGEDAEKFVLDYEKAMRVNHPNRKNIKIISDVDVGAGYDIQSYKDENSIFIDKFIEVKSYENTPHFYWSTNEIEVAKKEQDNYFLCLVDRNKVGNSGYEPTMIQNPYTNLLNNKKWQKFAKIGNFKVHTFENVLPRKIQDLSQLVLCMNLYSRRAMKTPLATTMPAPSSVSGESTSPYSKNPMMMAHTSTK